jgi:hypothetical protein
MISFQKRSLLATLLMLILIGLTACDVSQRETRRPGGVEHQLVSPTEPRTTPTDNLLPDVNRPIQSPSPSPTERGNEQVITEQPGESAESINCIDSNPHAIGQSIATTYDVPYPQVMTWFCSGYSFDNILIALETSEAVDIPADTLLQMLLENEWEEIWTEIGFREQP